MDEMALLRAMGHMLDEKLLPIHTRLERLERTTAQLTTTSIASAEELRTLKESQVEIRDGVNALLGWADEVAGVVKVALRPAN